MMELPRRHAASGIAMPPLAVKMNGAKSIPSCPHHDSLSQEFGTCPVSSSLPFPEKPTNLLSTELAASEPENLSSYLKKAMVVLSNHFHAAHIPKNI